MEAVLVKLCCIPAASWQLLLVILYGRPACTGFASMDRQGTLHSRHSQVERLRCLRGQPSMQSTVESRCSGLYDRCAPAARSHPGAAAPLCEARARHEGLNTLSPLQWQLLLMII